MTNTGTSTAHPLPESFVTKLDDLVRRKDRARLAALRQLVAPPERWGYEAYAAAMPLLPSGLHSNEERQWLSLTGLYATWHQGRALPAAHSGSSFGTAMRRLGRELSGGSEPSEAVERRFAVLLSSEDERLWHHLRQEIGQLSSAGIDVDFVRLLGGLRYWGHPDRFVQRRWARDFWAPTATHHVQQETE